MTIGIICEYNPFHNGHLYHLKKIKEMYKDSIIILVMSGNITQRGDLSIINKWDKTDIALYYGIDLVVELPFIYASSSADIFAKGAIEILRELKVDKIIFGSEINDINLLYKLADIQLNNKEYNKKITKYLEEGYNYPTSCGKALYDTSNINLNTPNDILGLCYIKEILKQGANIEAVSIKRTNNYNDRNLNNNITSATSIRCALKNNQDIKNYVPNYTYKYLKNLFYLDDYFIFIKYKILTSDITKYIDIDEKIKNRINKYINECKTLEDLILKIKCKNYSYNRIKRMLVHILVDLKKDDITYKNYIRILGFNNKGKIYLNKIKKEINLPLITNYSDSLGLLNLDYKISCILALSLPINLQKQFIENEKKRKIIFFDA